MQKKYQVFVSSTFRDLADERQTVIRNILDSNHIPAGMELFPAADMDQLIYIKKIIDECDYYLLLVGGRYGSVDKEGISYTEREYDYAVSTNKVVIAFVHNDVGRIPFDKSEAEPAVRDLLQKFRTKVMKGRLVKTWATEQDLQVAVLQSLMYAFNQMPQIGWVRGDSIASDETLAQANRALAENAELKKKLIEIRSTEVPEIENLADFDDKFDVRYSFTQFDDFGYAEVNAVVKLTWKQIFLGLASALSVAATDSVILEAISVAATEENPAHNVESLNPVDRATIKVQMLALGLITSEIHKPKTGGQVEYLSLTAKGKRIFIENKAVKKSIDS